MATFVCTWWFDANENMDMLLLSEKAYFEETGAMSDSYTDEQMDIFEPLFENLGIFELSESNYEITTTKAEVTAALAAHPEFEFSPEFAAAHGN